MSGTEKTPASVPLGDLTAEHASVTLLERLADKLGARASVAAVYGEPVTRDGVTVIPVARVGFGFGGGTGREIGTAKTAKTAEGGGGGGGLEARPLGFIEIKDGTAVYKPIRDPWTDVALPLVAVLAGVLGTKSVRALTRLRSRRRT
ncbi:spore germination protein GerW family protein [Streptomyces olivochromogenes]|uniref:spore germination protein GerW family protein n=1 Tax=Streptomyces olivochromogenes TaxID=1963 RepID=UPI001F420315|nr:spore germination protein GerW family protein [Streptomyces olivochromogenes]MCF3132294.1 sporulation protein [Streptomyces olivochromogenes]